MNSNNAIDKIVNTGINIALVIYVIIIVFAVIAFLAGFIYTIYFIVTKVNHDNKKNNNH